LTAEGASLKGYEKNIKNAAIGRSKNECTFQQEKNDLSQQLVAKKAWEV
jgi:ribosome modulation factor